ncbi:major facilitator superfamily multidrug resistance protein [Amycolatopsis methanolica 239]|uniref:Major facilitator superfamily multidrug resistance protein n=1 Tax=Amycolatopsis methanolica 239 TaxID=1068978 RepID=A0A076N554_AMYME|nr:major facilitator superfamily multidrug resistance protein [Amycolatopsis methanolica 239]
MLPATRRAWPRAAWSITAVGWGANQFSPLLGAYRREMGLSAATVTGLFAIYVLGLVPGLLLGGPGADRYGRRPVVLGAVALSVLATGALLLGEVGVPWLGVGRFASGFAMGAVLAAGSAWVKELSHPPHDDTAEGTGARRASLFLSAGFGIGGLVAALIAQWAPLDVAYLPHLVLSAVALVAALKVPETAPRAQPGKRVTGIRDPRFRRMVVPVAPWVFAAPATGFAVLPSLVESRLGGAETVFAGAAIAVVLGAGLLIQPVGRRLAARAILLPALIGLAAVGTGMLLGLAAAVSAQPVVALLADAALGCGYGLCVTFGLTEIARIAPPEGLARLASVWWALTYVGFCAPYVFALLTQVTTPPVILGCAAALAFLTGAGVALRHRTAPS